jgi:hypothetical protein
MTVDGTRRALRQAISEGHGIVRLDPAFVARDWIPAGRRLGMNDAEYDVGERGEISERWLASTTHAANKISLPEEGLSYVVVGSDRIALKAVIEADPAAVMGDEYAAHHEGLGRLAKIFDYGERVPYHLHPRREHTALLGRNPKDEAYYFLPGVEMGQHPESFFGVHPWIVEQKQFDVLLPYLEAWDSDEILSHAQGATLVPEEGFYIPSGILHAPGTALTLELQEDSDVLCMLQARVGKTTISKELLFNESTADARARLGERCVLELIDWQANGDPFFWENHHLSPQLIPGSVQPGGEEYWIYYNTVKFSGKKLVVRPGKTYVSRERGVYNTFVWRGIGSFAGHDVEGGVPGMDELLITHGRAVQPHEIHNSGGEDMLIVKFFGPDINPDVPMINRTVARHY